MSDSQLDNNKIIPYKSITILITDHITRMMVQYSTYYVCPAEFKYLL